jgi:hypothetical protein
MITYIKGDLFALLPDTDAPKVIPHVCNNLGKMGSGFVIPLCQKWPKVKEVYEAWHQGIHDDVPGWIGGIPFELGNIQSVTVCNDPLTMVMNMIAQSGVVGSNNPKPIKYAALAKCMVEVATLTLRIFELNYGRAEIHAPKFGSDRARGNWDFIAELIEECWVAKGIPVTIYSLE